MKWSVQRPHSFTVRTLTLHFLLRRRDYQSIAGIDYDSILDKLFDEVDAMVPQPGTPETDPSKAAWGAGVEDKFRKMGITL